MSITRKAVLAGSRVIGSVLVWRFRCGWIGSEVGVWGWVRSKPVVGLWSQKLAGEPIVVVLLLAAAILGNDWGVSVVRRFLESLMMIDDSIDLS